MNKNILSIAGILGVTAVILGAFGAHYLKNKLAFDQLQVFETGVRYQMYHALALLFLSALSEKLSLKYLNYTFYCFLIGTLLFSGSIYLLSCRTLLGIESWVTILGPITPLGGFILITGWIFIFISGISSKAT